MPFLAPLAGALYGAGTSLIVAGAKALTAIGIGGSAAWGISAAAVQFGASFLINSAISAVFGKKPKAQDVSAEMAADTTAPAVRFLYGKGRATGTPAGRPVKEGYIYGAWILNSRPSDLSSFTLYLDKREVALTGDAFDLTGAGATATEFPFEDHCTVWMSRGDHTAPPTAFTTEAPYVEGVRDDLWKTTDAWQGRTMIWLKLLNGGSGERQERWPSAPPLVEVDGKWSLICDPRNPAHDQDDPDTWEWTDNHALCVRDALMQNPIRQYRAGQIHGSFDVDGPDACDETVALNSGGTEPRYTCAGTVVWTDGEVEDQLNPMMISGAADFIRIGGKLGYAAGVYRAPTETMTYLLGDSFEFPDMIPGNELVNRLRVTYLSPARGYETAELTPWDIPGALAEDGGVPAVKTLDLPFCPSATQAMRVRKITGLRLRRQESIDGGTLPPEAFNLVGGATVNIALPAPYDALDGVYEVAGIHPGLDPIGESGEVAMRMPAALVKHSATIYAWTPATDEEEVYDEPFDSERQGVGLPGVISVTSGGDADLNTGGSIVPRFLFTFAPSEGASVEDYEWQFRLGGEDYETGGYIDANNTNVDGDLFFYLPVLGITRAHDVRVRAISASGISGFRELSGAVYGLALSGVSAVPRAGGLTVTGTAPSSTTYRGVKMYRANVGDDFSLATSVTAIGESTPGAAFSLVFGDPDAVNLVENGDFSDGSAWTLDANWTISGGVATHTPGAADFMSQAVVASRDDTFIRFTATISGRTAGGGGLRAYSPDGFVELFTASNTTHSGAVATPSGINEIRVYANSPFNGSFDNVFAVVSTPLTLPLGLADYWFVPVTVSGAEGAPVGPFTLQIP